MVDTKKLTRIFKALSSETRVRIVRLIKERALCVNALAARLDVTPAAVSQHLRILREAGLIVAEKRGYYVHYQVNKKELGRWRKAVDALLGGQPE